MFRGMTWGTSKRMRRQQSRRRRTRLPEQLESRQLLDAGGVTLVDDAVTVRQNQSADWLDVLANDEFAPDYSGDRQISAVSYGSQGGFVEISEDRTRLRYAPPADFEGVETLTYFVDGQFFARVDVTVQSPLKPDSYEIPPDGQVHRLSVLANDPFWAGYTGPKKITLASVSSAGSEVTIADDGKAILYRPTDEEFGTDQFVYIVDEIYPTRVTITVPQTLQNDEYEIIQNSSDSLLNVLANDPFWPGYTDPKTITSVDSSVEGSVVTVTEDGRALRYTPPAGWSGWDSIRYVVDDRFQATAFVVVQRPVQDDWHETDQDSTQQYIHVTANDRYWGQDRRYHDVVDQVTAVGVPESGGSVRIGWDGQGVYYTPPRGFSGTDRFTYLADGKHEATVTVEVTRPVRDDYVTAYQDTPRFPLNVLANDFLGNGYTGARQITQVSSTEQDATLDFDGRTIWYTPPDGFTGSDSFTYTVDDQLEAHVSVWVRPLTDGDYFRFCADPTHGTYSLAVLQNDYFGFGYPGPGRITDVEVLSEGASATVSTDGRSLLYRPSPAGYDQLRYIVDGTYEGSVSVSVTGHLVPDQFVVDQNSDQASLDVLQNDFQFNSPFNQCPSNRYVGSRRITAVSATEHGGVVEIAADGKSLRYTPADDFVGTDSFSYTVDGIMQSNVTMNVIRRVRDDQYRVAPGAEEEFRVLVNDLFGADYRGGGKITEVTSSTAGAQITIAEDGSAIRYVAPVDFQGTDRFVYTVDGRLKAAVQVEVRPDEMSLFPVFDTLEQYEQFLLDDALERYEYLFGQTVWYWHGWEDAENGGPLSPTDGGEVRDHSETNVQVAGVDEGDIVEFDSDYVYMLTGQDLVILDAWPATDLAEVSRVEIEGTPIGQYLKGDRLTVISRIDPYWPIWDYRFGPEIDGPPIGALPNEDLFPGRWPPYPIDLQSTTMVTVFDVTDRTAPQVIQQNSLEGSYIESRAIGDYVYLVLSNHAVAPPPIVIENQPTEDEPNPGPSVYETREQYLERFRANAAEFVQEALPNYTSRGPDGEVARSGLLHEPEDIFRPLSEGATNLVSLVSINVSNSEPGLAASSGIYTNGATKVYASLDHFYVFEDVYGSEDGTQTRILKFNWNGTTGEAEFAATGTIAGWMLNQFSADEYEGHLRIATTVSNSGSGNWTGREENTLFVLRDDGGVLEGVGSLQNLGLDETIRSVRFMGPRAFLVTFRNVDPLFGLDVSDPEQPRVLGHLTLPGFSSYMQLIDENHLLTVGRNTPLGNSGPLQVSLFDVTDLTRPRQIDEYTFERFSTSEAAVDHHAFGYFARHGLFALPSTRSYVERVDQDGDGYRETSQWLTEYQLEVFRVDAMAEPGTNTGLTLVAELIHDSPVRRSGYIENQLFSIADDSVHVVDVSAPDVILATAADLLRPVDPLPPDPVPEPLTEAAQQLIRQARTDLAGRLALPTGDIMTVTAEPMTNGLGVVLRVEEQQYFYRAGGSSVYLVDSAFQFADATEPIVWQNPVDNADANGDGEVAPNDALLIINELNQHGSRALPTHPALRQIHSQSPLDATVYWDVNGDGSLSPIDVLLVIDQLNRLETVDVDLSGVDPQDPSSASEQTVDRIFGDVQDLIGDSNLDGIFNTADLVLVLQAGEYEDGIENNSTWAEGDWDGDRDFTTGDFVLALQQGNYSYAARLADIAMAVWSQDDFTRAPFASRVA